MAEIFQLVVGLFVAFFLVVVGVIWSIVRLIVGIIIWAALFVVATIGSIVGLIVVGISYPFVAFSQWNSQRKVDANRRKRDK